ncbi:MAG: hypothetical protein IKU61_00495 [Clostridia bacterium]|nr:hypothetical protein [Clostridia bacterium]
MPKNYGGVAFNRASPPPKEEKAEPSPPKEEKNPLSCLLSAFSKKEKGGFDGEDFLILGLIALLIGKKGNEDILLILAMLLLT